MTRDEFMKSLLPEVAAWLRAHGDKMKTLFMFEEIPEAAFFFEFPKLVVSA